MIEKWTVLSEQDVSPNAWFPVMRHAVKLQNGTVVDDYFTAPFGRVAIVLPITTDNDMVLIKQYRHGVGEVLIELPAGFEQPGKSLEETALAELEEETGIRTGLDNLVSLGAICNNPAKTRHVTYGFLARDLAFNSRQALDVTENIELLKVKPARVLDMIASGEMWVGDSVSFIMKARLLYPALFS